MPFRSVDLSSIKDLFRPDQVAQVIVDEEARGTDVTDEFYPPSVRRPWDQVLVPVEAITSVTNAVPMVRRGSDGMPISGESMQIDYIEPQAVKTYDALSAVGYNNAREVGPESVQDWANRQIARHLETHRKTTNALAADSLDGQISFPIYNAQGTKVDDFVVDFTRGGAHPIKTYTVSADWTAGATTLATIHGDLREMRQVMRHDGKAVTDILLGNSVFDAILDKINGLSHDTRFPARMNDDGSITLGAFRLRNFDAEYQDPETGTYSEAIGTNEVMMYDANADWSLLRVRLDNFKMLNAFGASALRRSPMGVVAEFSESGDTINVYAQSKPFPIPPVRSILSTDATVT